MADFHRSSIWYHIQRLNTLRAQLSFAPSKIHVQTLLRTQPGNGLCPNGMRILEDVRPYISAMRLLVSGCPGITTAPNVVPYIKPS